MRKIIHIDMDAFYASIEQRDCSDLRGKPLVVGGAPEARGVVAAASYEARRFGVRSAMSSNMAKRLCPQAIFVPPNMQKYKAVSREIMSIFYEHTELVEPLSLDEAYLDVTINTSGQPSATELAKTIRRQIRERTSLTASAGVAPNKFLAKIASDMNKPDGLTVIPPHEVEKVLERLPVGKLPGVGRVTEDRMARLGILTTRDLRARTEAELMQLFGKTGRWYYNIARGIDERPVVARRQHKSVSVEDTFCSDLIDLAEINEALADLGDRLWRRAAKSEFCGRTVVLKLTYGDFTKITRSRTLTLPPRDAPELLEIAANLLATTEAGSRPLRLLGIGLGNPTNAAVPSAAKPLGPIQLGLPFK